MLWSKCHAIALIVVLALMFGVADSMRFEVNSGQGKCISEDIKANAMTVGKYGIVNPNEEQPLPDDYRITVKVGFYLLKLLFPFKKSWVLMFTLNYEVILFCL